MKIEGSEFIKFKGENNIEISLPKSIYGAIIAGKTTLQNVIFDEFVNKFNENNDKKNDNDSIQFLNESK